MLKYIKIEVLYCSYNSQKYEYSILTTTSWNRVCVYMYMYMNIYDYATHAYLSHDYLKQAQCVDREKLHTSH